MVTHTRLSRFSACNILKTSSGLESNLRMCMYTMENLKVSPSLSGRHLGTSDTQYYCNHHWSSDRHLPADDDGRVHLVPCTLCSC